jgi:hypothetical protein
MELAALPPIGLEELNAEAALQTRVDRKYVVPAATARQAWQPSDQARVLEMDGLPPSPTTPSTSTPRSWTATCWRPAAAAAATRSAPGPTWTPAQFPRGQDRRAREATVKERIPYHMADRSRLTAEGLEYVNETLATASVGDVPAGRLGPVLETRYRRTTLYLPESGSRATIDSDVTWQTGDGQPWVLDDSVVLETKSGSTAGPLDRHLWQHGVRPSRISKFATGMAALHPHLPANRWNRTLRHSMRLAPAA